MAWEKCKQFMRKFKMGSHIVLNKRLTCDTSLENWINSKMPKTQMKAIAVILLCTKTIYMTQIRRGEMKQRLRT